MAWQLIYTSAARGLVPGRSGFCTVARHREIRDALVTAIERVSQYGRSSRSAVGPSVHPVIFSHRVIAVGSSVYHVLSRIRDAGSDYTGRTNHLAHHLICEQHEIAAAPSPAEILLQMPWPDTAPETPRFFTDADVINLSHFHTSLKLPAATWGQLTGDAGSAAVPFDGAALAGCYWIRQPEGDQRLLLRLFAESLLLLNPRGNTPEKLWQFPFTTYFQGTDSAADFLWRGCWPESRAMLAAAQGSKVVIDLTRPRSLAAPQNSIAEFARNGGTAFDAPSIFAQVPEPEFGTAEPVETISDPDRPVATGEELDIESLLAKADAMHRGKPAASKHRQRKPHKNLLIAGLALLALLSLALLTYFLRDSFAEKHLGGLAKLRHENKLAEASKEAAGISGFLRSHGALCDEIKRVTVASALAKIDADADPEKAESYLNSEETKKLLDEPAIKDNDRIPLKVEGLRKWVTLDKEVNELGGAINEPSLRNPEQNQKIRHQITSMDKAIQDFSAATWTKAYGQAVSKKFRAVQGSYVEARLAALEKVRGQQPRPPDFSEQLNTLRKDAEQFGAFEAIRPRFEKIDPTTSVTQGGPPDKPPVPPPNPAAVPAPVLGAMVTYIAFATADSCKISAVSEMGGGLQWPNPAQWKIELHRQATSPNAPSTSQPCTIREKKLYAGTQEVLTLTEEETLILNDAELKKGNFILRFTNSKEAGANFQIFCFQANAPNAPVAEEPLAGSLQRKDENTLELSKALLDKLWRNAAAGARTLVVKADGLGGEELPVKEEAGFGRIDLGPAIKTTTDEKNKPLAVAPVPAPQADTEITDSKKGRDLLTVDDAESNKLGFWNLGHQILGNKLDEQSPVRTFPRFFRESKPTTVKPQAQQATGKDYVKYTQAVLREDIRVLNEFREAHENRLKEIENKQMKPKDKIHAMANAIKENDEATVKANTIRDLVNDLTKYLGELPSSNLNAPQLNEIIKVWQQAAKSTDPRWGKIFTPENIKKIKPFLLWNGGDLDAALKDAKEARKNFSKNAQEQAKERVASSDAKLSKLKGDVKDLAPLLILIKSPGGQQVPLVRIVAPPAPAKKEPAPTPPPK